MKQDKDCIVIIDGKERQGMSCSSIKMKQYIEEIIKEGEEKMKRDKIDQILKNQMIIMNTLSNMVDKIKGKVDKKILYKNHNDTGVLLKQ